MDEIGAFANYIKSCRPREKIGITTGKVISLAPLEISISDKITVKPPKLVTASGLGVEIGDKVIVIASDDNKTFYAIARTG